ncbi:ras GTPAse, putative [Hepatocystis sp. ex Piliocolobus tephrosceles]|nr:ras GTPAse, putative [Hepatocystis sp. ex Piliocolobus tephrosceles]
MESLKILVLGDLGVGKSSFLKLISERFCDIYPINYFDYFTYIDEGNKNVEGSNNSSKQQLERAVESVFFQTKKNLLEFIETQLNSKSTFFEERHKYTYGYEIYTFLWNKNCEYNNNMFEQNMPINILRKGYHFNNLYMNTQIQNNNTSSNKLNSSNSNDINNSNNNNEDNILFVEFFEIGGVETYAYIRNIFYENHDGILLVYDTSNNQSYHNLVNWLYELYINTKPPSDIFCTNENKGNIFWNFFFKKNGNNSININNKTKKKKKKMNKKINPRELNYNNNEEDTDDDYSKNSYYINNIKKKKRNTFCNTSDYYYDDDMSDIEKGVHHKNEQILEGEIPIACVATKIDKKDSKEKPAFVKTPKKHFFYNLFFPGFLTNIAIYQKNSNFKIKKEILKKLEYNISKAIEIKASSIDYVVDIEKFLTFLKNVYNKKYNSPD